MMEGQAAWTVELLRRDLDQTPRYEERWPAWSRDFEGNPIAIYSRLHSFKQKIVGQSWANENGNIVYKGLYIQYI
jgi:hypothetical protein